MSVSNQIAVNPQVGFAGVEPVRGRGNETGHCRARRQRIQIAGMELAFDRIEPAPLRGQTAHSQVWGRAIVFPAGSRTVVRAPSGAGKTTLISILYGLRSDYAGRIRLDGRDLRELGITEWALLRRRRLGLVPQDLQLFDDLTAWENVELKNRLTRHRARQAVEGWFERLGVGGLQRRPAGTLSLGQRQRVALIRALCQPFEMLLLDEPFSHLDEDNTRRAIDLVEAECAGGGAGWVLTSLAGDRGLAGERVMDL